VAIILGYFILSKNHNKPPKVAQSAKIAQSGHPDPDECCSAERPFAKSRGAKNKSCLKSHF
jgi:hypothetical protein